MTREEAIEAVKAKMDYYESDKRLRAALETLIPELRESEDEKAINLIRSLLENVRAVQSNTSLYKQYDDALAWLEKKKDSVSNAKYIEDVAHAFEDGRKKGIEEKQKEQKPHWKPTEAQIKALDTGLQRLRMEIIGPWPVLTSLYNDLKKQMEQS